MYAPSTKDVENFSRCCLTYEPDHDPENATSRKNIEEALLYGYKIVNDDGVIKDVDVIKEMHAIITRDELPEDKRGVFSTERRATVVDDHLHEYPYHESMEDAERAVKDIFHKHFQYLMHAVDYHETEEDCKDPPKSTILHAGCKAVTDLLTEHPFSDGNGRVARCVLALLLTPTVQENLVCVAENMSESMTKCNVEKDCDAFEKMALKYVNIE